MRQLFLFEEMTSENEAIPVRNEMDTSPTSFRSPLAAETVSHITKLQPDPLPLSRATRLIEKRRIESFLNQHSSREYKIVLTKNRRTMLSSKPVGTLFHIRMHEMFVRADNELLLQLLNYLEERKVQKSARALDAFIAKNQDAIRKPKRISPIKAVGKYFDLNQELNRLKEEYFVNEAVEPVAITWGKSSKRRKQTSIHLGSYSPEDRIIRIHPKLDQSWIPRYVVQAVLHHELLHHLLGGEKVGMRTHYHTPDFRRREREFVYFKKAETWLDKNLATLLRS